MSRDSLAGRTLRGAAAMLLLRWASRLLGLVSISITARLLTPDDFGLMGTASIVVGFLLKISEIGMGEALVRAVRLDPGRIHTAWTLRTLISLTLGLALFIPADWFAALLHEPRVGDVIRVMAFMPVIEALASPATALLARDMDYRRLFFLRVWIKIAIVVSTIILALMLGNYWALVWGQVVGSVATVVLTHLYSPYRPRFSLSHFSVDGSFTAWTLLRDLSTYIADRVDEIVVRLTTSTSVFALFHASRDLSRIFITEIVSQAASPLFSAFSKLQGEPARLVRAVTASLGVSAMLLAAVGVMISYAAEPLIHLVLGNQWLNAAPMLKYLALGAAVQTLARMNRGLYSVLDRQHISVAMWATRAGVLAVTLWPAALFGTPVLVAQTFLVVNAVLTFFDVWLVFRLQGAPYPVVTLFRSPLVGGGAMALSLHALTASPTGWLIADLACMGLVGSLAFGCSVLGLWLALGRPDGPEKALLQHAPEAVRRRLGVRD